MKPRGDREHRPSDDLPELSRKQRIRFDRVRVRGGFAAPPRRTRLPMASSSDDNCSGRETMRPDVWVCQALRVRRAIVIASLNAAFIDLRQGSKSAAAKMGRPLAASGAS